MALLQVDVVIFVVGSRSEGVFVKRRDAISTFDLGHRIFVDYNEAQGI